MAEYGFRKVTAQDLELAAGVKGLRVEVYPDGSVIVQGPTLTTEELSALTMALERLGLSPAPVREVREANGE